MESQNLSCHLTPSIRILYFLMTALSHEIENQQNRKLLIKLIKLSRSRPAADEPFPSQTPLRVAQSKGNAHLHITLQTSNVKDASVVYVSGSDRMGQNRAEDGAGVSEGAGAAERARGRRQR